MSNQITLNHDNSIDFLIQFTELAQKNGVFNLQEADLLKKAVDSIKNSGKEISKSESKKLLIQAVVKGQSKGVYSLVEASVLYNICLYLAKEEEQGVQSHQSSEIKPLEKIQEEPEEDLFDLSAPVPLKTTRV
jgi:hypothetical protein